MWRGRLATRTCRRRRATRASPSTRSATSKARWSGWASTSRADRRPPDRDRMARPRLEVADVFRAHGEAWRKANAGHVGLGQLKVMSAIETCRTAALGGHVERCEDCAHERVAYNSCLMGKIRNGESMGVDIGFGGFRGLCGPHYERPLSMAMSLSGGRKGPSRDAAERWPLWL